MNVKIQLPINFVAGVYYNGEVRMNTYNLRLWVVTNTTDSESHNVAFERIRHFIFNCIDSAVFISVDKHEQAKKLAAASVRVVTLPTEPVDQVVGVMLYHKLNAISEDRLIIVETELSSALGEHVVYMHGDDEMIYNIEPLPWWDSSDLSHCETDLLDHDNVVSVGHKGAWRDLDLAWPEDQLEHTEETTVVYADFGKNETK